MGNEQLIQKVLEIETRAIDIEENMATKKDMDRIVTILDGIVVIVNRLDGDRFATNNRIGRIEEKLGIKPYHKER